MRIDDNSLGMTVLRAWMWLVPIAMLIASIGFGAWAAVDGKWALFAMMCVMAAFALGLLFFHYWILYRFGKDAPQ